jgi:hypothetical protein
MKFKTKTKKWVIQPLLEETIGRLRNDRGCYSRGRGWKLSTGRTKKHGSIVYVNIEDEYKEAATMLYFQHAIG